MAGTVSYSTRMNSLSSSDAVAALIFDSILSQGARVCVNGMRGGKDKMSVAVPFAPQMLQLLLLLDATAGDKGFAVVRETLHDQPYI